jgi:hypothetical protein
MKTKRLLGISLLCLPLAVSAAKQAAVDNLPFNSVQEKRNTTVKVIDAAVADIGDVGRENGLHGATADFQGRRLPLWVLFAPSVQEEQFSGLADHQGRIAGTVQCDLVRVGSSPHFPQNTLGVLAQNCVIKNLR